MSGTGKESDERGEESPEKRKVLRAQGENLAARREKVVARGRGAERKKKKKDDRAQKEGGAPRGILVPHTRTF